MSSVLGFLQQIGAQMLGFLGGWDATLKMLVAMMALDYTSGLAAACLGKSPHSQSGRIDSRAGLSGLLKKGLILMVLAVAAQIDDTMDGSFVRGATAWFYIINEGISVLENAALAGVPMPQKLKDVLGMAKKELQAGGAEEKKIQVIVDGGAKDPRERP